MAKIAVATRQTAWNCRWSRTGARITELRDGTGPETPWVCIKHPELRTRRRLGDMGRLRTVGPRLAGVRPMAVRNT